MGHKRYDYLRQSTSSPFEWELRTLTGEVFVYDWASPTGKLIAIRDSLATPNVVTLSYDGSGRLQYVTDAQGSKRLSFEYTASHTINRVRYQTISGGTPTNRMLWDFGYNNNNLVNAQANSGATQVYSYSGGKLLTLIEDNNGNDVSSFTYVSGSGVRAVARLATSYGELGFEYNSGRSSCTSGTVLYFNRQGTTTCDDDSDCGAGLLCGGETDPASANTGVCYRAARCMQVNTSASEDLVTTVGPLGPPSESCEGACTSVAEYVWNTSSALELKAIKDPASYYTTYAYNADGLPTTIVYGDIDDNPTNGNGARTMWLYYDNATFPGLVTETRRKSDISTSTCSSTVSTGCQRTLYTYTTGGRIATREEKGFTLDSSGAATAFTYTTTFSYDSNGRLTQIDGPLSGSNDITDFTYWSSSDVYKNGQLKELKRKRNSTDYLVTTFDGHNYWSKATSIQSPDGTYSCLTYDAIFAHLTVRREAMNGQTSCSSSHSSDLTTSYTRDRWYRLTKAEHPAGGCTHYEYDAKARLVSTKLRDDCTTASAGEKQDYTYDDDGLRIKTETFDAAGNVKRRQEQTYYDSRRIHKVINPVNTSKATQVTYNTRGLVDIVDDTDAQTKTVMGYDGDDRVTSVSRYLDATNFDTWDLVNSWLDVLSKVTDDDNKVIDAVRDDASRKVKVVTPDSGTTLRLFNADGTLGSMVEADGTASERTHAFTSDVLGRTLTADYAGDCGQTTPPPEIQNAYDALPGGVSCPSGFSCAKLSGRLAYTKVSLLCDSSLSDKSLDQETFYAYDDAGRLIGEYIVRDGPPGGTSSTHNHAYAWNKNNNLSQVTLPSTAVLGWDFGSTGSNSDQGRVTAAWRTTPASGPIDNITYFPFGALESYRHKNTLGGTQLQTKISRNLAYRKTAVRVEKTTGTLVFETAITEDTLGRVTARDFSGGHGSLQDSFFQYDMQSRLVRECIASDCSGVSKNHHDSNPPFTASNDWKHFTRPIPGSSGTNHEVTLVSGKDQISTIVQPDTPFGAPAIGTTTYTWNVFGERTEDNNGSTLSYDERTYTYDARQNLKTVSGKYKTALGSWHPYVVSSAYDARNRRVFKSFFDATDNKQAHWFFYYDAHDRLSEVRHTPDVSAGSTYSVYQIVWLGGRAVAFWRTDYPSATTTRFFVHTDETTRPLELYDWPSSGDTTRAWATNPDAYGNDKCINVLIGANSCSLFQPFVHPGQYRDTETIAWRDDGATEHRPAQINNWFRGYDSFAGSYIQVESMIIESWDSYSYVGHSPVGRVDRTGLLDEYDDGSGICCQAYEVSTCGAMVCIDYVECGYGSGTAGGGVGNHPPPQGGGGGAGGGNGCETQMCLADETWIAEFCGCFKLPDPLLDLLLDIDRALEDAELLLPSNSKECKELYALVQEAQGQCNADSPSGSLEPIQCYCWDAFWRRWRKRGSMSQDACHALSTSGSVCVPGESCTGWWDLTEQYDEDCH